MLDEIRRGNAASHEFFEGIFAARGLPTELDEGAVESCRVTLTEKETALLWMLAIRACADRSFLLQVLQTFQKSSITGAVRRVERLNAEIAAEEAELQKVFSPEGAKES